MRIKRGATKRKKHKAILEQAKGYRMSYSKLYRRAREALLHAGEYNFAHRKKRQSQFRKYWIKSINAACRNNNTTYSKFIKDLENIGVVFDRKIMSFIAVNDPQAMNKLIIEASK